MEFLELAKERYSVRKYKAQQIEQEKLDKILEAGNIAPTAVNYQPQRIYVLQSKEALAKAKVLCPCTYDAPTVLMIAYDAVYCGTKHFVRAMMDSFRSESIMEGSNIRTTTIYPGAIKTELLNTVATSEMMDLYFPDIKESV